MSKQFVIPAKMMRNIKIDQLNQNRIERVDYETINLVKRGTEDNETEKYTFFGTVDITKAQNPPDEIRFYEAKPTALYNYSYNLSVPQSFRVISIGSSGSSNSSRVYTRGQLTYETSVKFIKDEIDVKAEITTIKFLGGNASSYLKQTIKTSTRTIELQKLNYDIVNTNADLEGNYYCVYESEPNKIVIGLHLELQGVYGVGDYPIAYNTNVIITTPYYDEEIENKFVGIENSDYTFILESSNFYNKDTIYNDVELGEYNAQKILDNYRFGKERVSLECIIGNYYDRNNNLVYSKDSEEPIMDIGDTFELYNPNNRDWENGYYRKKFIITDREFSYNGIPTLKIQGKEV